ncbi:methionine/alanine import family NSS transporter small subunit [Dermabacteraceae bacterium P13115]|nr:methionine/alanine import family NSS transporter small subunit [Dermabacteraceae bacterium TAE3-ERU5]
MSASAIAMLVGSIVIIWGGLAASVVHLMRTPEETD